MTWKDLFKKGEVAKILDDVSSKLIVENKTKVIYPERKNLFKAFELCPIENLKVVILGQDPYHGEGQAMGLSFSVPKNIKSPPSLQNIFKELESDINIKNTSPDLTSWAKQGVLLLNSILTVEASSPASHSKIGWEKFTDEIIKNLSLEKENLVFVLWGNFAISKKNLIDEKKHLILTSPHPSPFSVHKGFFGSKPFSKINSFLISKGLTSIDWKTD